MHDIETCRLGETDEILQLEDRDENIIITNQMAKQCQKSLHIISRKLDPFIFDTEKFADAVKHLALHHRRAQIQIIVFDADIIVQRGHRLLNIASQLSSFIELRKAHHSFNNYKECLMLADTIGYIHRKNGERYESTSNFKDRRYITSLHKEFTRMWELAAPDLNLRKMVL